MEKIISAKEVIRHSRGIATFPIIAMVIGYGIVLFSRAVLNDADTYWHIETGLWILDHRAVPHADPFSYALAGAPWVAHEWLSEVLMALAYRAAAWRGIVIFFGAAAAATCGMLARYLARYLNQPTATAAFLLGSSCVAPSLLTRPHLLALAALTTWAIHLLSAKDQGTAPPAWLLPVMTAWANLHASFVFGLLLVLPIALEAVFESEERRWWMARRWAVFLMAATAASLLTPNGWRGLFFPFQLVRLASSSSIIEWAPTSFRTFQPLEGALFVVLYIAFTRNLRLPIGRLLTVLGVLYLALAHSRHQMLAGVVGSIVLAKPLGHALNTADGAANREVRHNANRRWIVAGVACIVLLTAIRLTRPIARTDDRVSPVTALSHVPADIRKERVFNDYNFGGYLIFVNVKPFIDGRADLYGDEYISAYLSAVAPNRATFARIVEKYRIRWALVIAGSPAADMISALPDWRCMYTDDIAIVYVREPATQETNYGV